MNLLRTSLVIGIAVASLFAPPTSAHGDIADLNTWTQVQDLADPDFSASVDTATQISLLAGNGSILSATDIGYQSVNGSTPALSTAGHAFDPATDFQVAIDFDMSFQNTPVGGLAIGFGIGEDSAGMNSAGAGLFTQNGVPSLFFGAAARVNDANQGAQPIFVFGQLSGSLFAAYDASTGDVTLGVGSVGANAPDATANYAGLQNNWNGGLLLAAFFLRSDDFFGPAWTSGNATAIFSDFRVISGSPVTVPEPATLSLVVLAAVALLRFRQTRFSMGS